MNLDRRIAGRAWANRPEAGRSEGIPPPAKGKKKNGDDTDIGMTRPEAVLIVVTLEAPAPR